MLNLHDTKIILDYEVLTTFYSEINDAEYEIIRMKIDYLTKNFLNKCEICSKSFSKCEYLQKHTLNQHGIAKNEKIDEGNEKNKIESMVIKIESNVIKDDCDSNEYDADVNTEDIEDIHIDDIEDIHAEDIEYKCGIGNDLKPLDIERNEYKCNICIVTFKTNQGYQNHLRAHRMGTYYNFILNVECYWKKRYLVLETHFDDFFQDTNCCQYFQY